MQIDTDRQIYRERDRERERNKEREREREREREIGREKESKIVKQSDVNRYIVAQPVNTISIKYWCHSDSAYNFLRAQFTCQHFQNEN